MKKKGDKATVAVEVEVTTETDRLSASDERILRMRSGASLPKSHRLENKLDEVSDEHRDELEAKLALIEAEALDKIEENPELRTDKKLRIIEVLKNLSSDN